MPRLSFDIHILISEIDSIYRAEVLRFPELMGFGETADDACKVVTRQAARAIEWLDTRALHRLSVATPPKLDELDIELTPPREAVGWEEALGLTFGYVTWSMEDGRRLAHVPTFDIDVVAPDNADFGEVVREEIRDAFLRNKATRALASVDMYSRLRLVEIRRETVHARIDSSSQQLDRELSTKKEKNHEQVLKEVGTKTLSTRVRHVFEMDELIKRISAEVSSVPGRSVLLVGKSGTGKTAAVHEMAAHPHLFGMLSRSVWETSGARIVAGMSGFGQWQERCLEIIEAAKAEYAVLHLGNLIELMDVGKSANFDQGIASFLRPFIARNELTVVAECTPEQIPVIERDDPLLTQAFTRIDVEEPDRATAEKILLEHARFYGRRQQNTILPQSIKEVDRLHRRYTPYSAYPGRPLRFITNYVRGLKEDETTSTSGVVASFSRETGLPIQLLDDSMSLDLDRVREWFGERVIGQQTAVDLIADRLGWIKTELTRPGKPIASLLFVGPTGVGKTQMAKTLAQYLFASQKRMVRFDMSEYRDPVAVKRLIGGVYGDEGLLTAKVREQPFCVVLFDEIEKAHPMFFDILLQVMGEGRLSDAKGRVADFCSTVIIMTSNLGVREFQRAPMSFTDDKNERATEHFTEEVRRFVRPELFNRIDRIVPFQALERDVIRTICQREVDLAQHRHGLRFSESVMQIDHSVIDHLVDVGYDERYGARPLKRAIEREVLLPIADRINKYAGSTKMDINVQCKDGRVDVEIRAIQDDAASVKAHSTLVREVQELRRFGSRLKTCSAYREISNQLFLREQMAKRKRKRRKQAVPMSEQEAKVMRQLKALRELVENYVEESSHLEDGLLEDFFQHAAIKEAELCSEIERIRLLWHDTLTAIYATRFDSPDYVCLEIYGQGNHLLEVARMYTDVAAEWQHRVSYLLVLQALQRDIEDLEDLEERTRAMLEDLGVNEEAEEEKKPIKTIVRSVPSLDEVNEAQEERNLYGIVMLIRDNQSALRFMSEGGLQKFIQKSNKYVYIETSQDDLDDYEAPEGVERKGFVPASSIPVRTYDANKGRISELGGKTYVWKKDNTVAVLKRILEDRMHAAALRILEEK